MNLKDAPIRRKIMTMIMLTSLTVLTLTVAAFMIYDLVTIRDTMARDLATLARIVAENSTAALAFRNEQDATATLASLQTESQVTTAALYDSEGKVFVTYPPATPPGSFPPAMLHPTHRFESSQLVLFEPVMRDNARLGTICLKADLRPLYRRLKIYAGIAGLIVLASVAVALLLSHQLQKRISDPVVALAETARQISERRDFSVRARKTSNDELGLLTDAFNQMLTRIQEQTVAMQEGESRLRLALEASRIGTWDWNLATGRITWDERNVALFGLRPGEFQETFDHFKSFVHPDDRVAVERRLKESLEHKQGFLLEFRIVWPDGSIHDVVARGSALYNEAGQAVRMSGVTQDITERKRSEEASRRLAAIVASSDDAIISRDLNGIVTSWNQAAERLFGYTAAEAIGKSITIIIPAERHHEEPQLLERLRRGERVEHFETVRQRKDGSQLDVSISQSPVRDAEGHVVGASKISRDITEAKRAREALERQALMLREQAQMLDLANVMARDLDDRIILWNTGMEAMYGWLRTETLGRVSHTILNTKASRPLAEIRAELMREGQWQGELIHTHKDGRELIVNSQWVLHKDHDGHPTAILEINTDITDRKRAAEQLQRMNLELEQRVRERTMELTLANQELESFTYSVAHDLRAPLRHIDAFTKILLDDFSEALPAEALRYLNTIRKGSQNMSQLVDDLLNLARVGRQELKHEVTPLNPIVDEVIGELTRDLPNREIEWHIDPLPTIKGDPGLVKQVFANLLSNAVKYTRPRTKAVIGVGRREVDGETVIFVQDNGVGFNMKYADKLFGVFQRLHRTEEFEGTGVGLAIVDRVVRRHGGHIWAESELGKGATFFFTLNGLDKHSKQNEVGPA